MIPGHTAFTRTPAGASARADCCVRLMTAALLAAYGGDRLATPRPAVEEMLMIIAPAVITRAASWEQKNSPRALTSSVMSQSSSDTEPNGLGRISPALLTRMS